MAEAKIERSVDLGVADLLGWLAVLPDSNNRNGKSCQDSYLAWVDSDLPKRSWVRHLLDPGVARLVLSDSIARRKKRTFGPAPFGFDNDIPTDPKQEWRSENNEGGLQISQSSVGSYFKEQSPSKWELWIPQDPVSGPIRASLALPGGSNKYLETSKQNFKQIEIFLKAEEFTSQTVNLYKTNLWRFGV
ncbi:hypothetical protein IMY05_002G0175500 [Salix suchowensis]|nr:hypothetical protein IMY05_002G0175500 [Salix suchowensis]